MEFLDGHFLPVGGSRFFVFKTKEMVVKKKSMHAYLIPLCAGWPVKSTRRTCLCSSAANISTLRVTLVPAPEKKGVVQRRYDYVSQQKP